LENPTSGDGIAIANELQQLIDARGWGRSKAR
jgi:hypothetical protein